MSPTPFTAVLVVALALASPAWAKNEKAKGAGKPAHAEKVVKGKDAGSSNTSDSISAAAAAGATLAGILLSDADKTTITRYFATHPQPSKPLPPGIAKNLERGKPLPPGIAKRGVPNDLSHRLNLAKGYELETVGTDVVLIEAGTRIVADILKDVLAQ